MKEVKKIIWSVFESDIESELTIWDSVIRSERLGGNAVKESYAMGFHAGLRAAKSMADSVTKPLE